MDIRFERATIENVDELITVRSQSFYQDNIKYGKCPGYNISKEDMTNSILNRISYKIICNNQIVGSICVRDNRDRTESG